LIEKLGLMTEQQKKAKEKTMQKQASSFQEGIRG
jgi:hypothetical protein